MDLSHVLTWALGLLSQVPVAGPYLVIAGKAVAAVSVVAASISAVLHVVVTALQMLDTIPLLTGKLQPLADALKNDEAAAEGWYQTVLLPLLQPFSPVPLPQLGVTPSKPELTGPSLP